MKINAENLKWKKEVSAGGVVYKKQDGRVFVLIVNPRSDNYGPPTDYWTWPKGLMEDEEKGELAETALREVKEETGVTGKIVTELGYVKFFRSEGKGRPGAIKFAHYFLMEYVEGNTDNHDNENAEARWVDAVEVDAFLKFTHDKEILGRALDALQINIK